MPEEDHYRLLPVVVVVVAAVELALNVLLIQG